jgi:hypothetical protein
VNRKTPTGSGTTTVRVILSLSPILGPLSTCVAVTLFMAACGSTPTEPTFVGLAKPIDSMTGLTITSDLPNTLLPQIKLGTPVEFSVVGHGGRPPYEFRWRVNGILLRDWDPATTLTFTGVAADGRSTGWGRMYFTVQGRSHGRTPDAFGRIREETGGLIQFDIANCDGADRFRPICQSGR